METSSQKGVCVCVWLWKLEGYGGWGRWWYLRADLGGLLASQNLITHCPNQGEKHTQCARSAWAIGASVYVCGYGAWVCVWRWWWSSLMVDMGLIWGAWGLAYEPNRCFWWWLRVGNGGKHGKKAMELKNEIRELEGEVPCVLKSAIAIALSA